MAKRQEDKEWGDYNVLGQRGQDRPPQIIEENQSAISTEGSENSDNLDLFHRTEEPEIGIGGGKGNRRKFGWAGNWRSGEFEFTSGRGFFRWGMQLYTVNEIGRATDHMDEKAVSQ